MLTDLYISLVTYHFDFSTIHQIKVTLHVCDQTVISGGEATVVELQFRGLPNQWPQFETVKPLVMFKLTSGQLHACLYKVGVFNETSGHIKTSQWRSRQVF